MSVLATFIEDGQRLIAQCPHCDELFQVLHARFIFPAKDPGRCDYADLLALQATTSRLSGRLDRAQERFELERDAISAAATALGQRKARRHVLRIDQVFSARKIDPQDVKVLFDPVDYVVFHGLNGKGVKEVRFMSHEPESVQQERIVKAIAKVIKAGEVRFSTLRVNKEGGIDGERA